MLHETSPFEPVAALRLNYRYTIKVWLTSILLGTILFFVYQLIKDMPGPEGSILSGTSNIFYFIITLALAVIVSVPSILLFALGYNFITGFIYNSFRIKCALCLIGQTVCWFSFLIGFGLNNEEAIKMNLDIILPYALAAFVSIFTYRLSSSN
jgi:hypothetical protein